MEKFGCIKCGYMGKNVGDPVIIDGKEYFACPVCGNDNTGGYPCFLEWYLWPEEMQSEILELNQELNQTDAG